MLDIQENIPLAPLTTFGIGGPARYFVEVGTEGEIREAIVWAREKGVPFHILAGGSNILVPDEGLEALVIKVVGDDYRTEKNILEAHPGCNLLSLILAVGGRGLGGWEKLAGIPGTLGGAVRGNAGAFGSEIKDLLDHVRAFNIETEEVREFENEECEFAYRESFFKKNPNWVIIRVFIRLQEVDLTESKKLAEETVAEREKRHIQNVRAAGSYFMNPIVSPKIVAMFEEEKKVKSRGGRVPAGWLIEKAGMKGARIGDAVASEQHPNYLKNDGNATAKDVLTLAGQVKSAVRDKFGVELKEEAVIIG